MSVADVGIENLDDVRDVARQVGALVALDVANMTGECCLCDDCILTVNALTERQKMFNLRIDVENADKQMDEILDFLSKSDEYDRNGNVVLDPIECTATFSLDGNWSMHMELPITKNMSTLDDISVVAADTPYGKKQRYRIYGYSKNDTTMSLECLPIFFDSRNHILMDVRPTNKNGQEALNTMLSGTGFTGKSNISKKML